MTPNQQHLPIVCNLDTLTDRASHEKISTDLMRQATHINETENGYTLHFPTATLQQVATFVDGERQCCAFLDFTIHIPTNAQDITLHLTGSNAAKDFIKSELLPRLPASLR